MDEGKDKMLEVRCCITFNCFPIKGYDEGFPGMEASARRQLGCEGRLTKSEAILMIFCAGIIGFLMAGFWYNV
jgi:hypothetical protein